MKARAWMMQYGVAIVMAALFAAILGQIPLFRETMVGKFRAANLVEFIGFGAALITAWVGARHIAMDQTGEWKWLGAFRELVLPATTLVVLPMAYGAMLLLLGPFLGKDGRAIYNWMFVIGIVAASCWVILAWVQKCAPQMAAAESERKEHKQAA
ncbi:MAG: hypothetical protein OEV08_03775 [Nitrospira sp.]|nr:hypothetical protein [Nitrospira sp.]